MSQGALYFGVESLLLKCEMWFSEVSSSKGFQSTQIEMEDLIQIWKFGLEHGKQFGSKIQKCSLFFQIFELSSVLKINMSKSRLAGINLDFQHYPLSLPLCGNPRTTSF